MNKNFLDIDQGIDFIDDIADEYDALFEADEEEEKDSEEIAETFGYIGNPEELAPQSEIDAPIFQSPRERIDYLFENMPPFKRNFIRLLEFCQEPRSIGEIDGLVSEFQSSRLTVYNATSYCQMLEGVGALAKITEEGVPYEEVDFTPIEVERDGQKFIEASIPPPVFWQTTEDGLLVLAEDDPVGSLQNIFFEQEKYKNVFVEILELCKEPEGISINEIKKKVNRNPVLEHPAKTAQFFMEYLDRNGALAWDKGWRITTIGEKALELLKA